MAAWNSIQRGNIIACRTQGYDPTAIVGEGNLLPTSDNPGAYTGIPTEPEDKALASREISVADLQAIPAPEPAGARGYTRKGDPYAGMGDF